MQSKIKKHISTELLIDLIQGALEEEGCRTKRFSDGDTYFTTSYDCIMVEDADGNHYKLTIDEYIPREEIQSRRTYDPGDTCSCKSCEHCKDYSGVYNKRREYYCTHPNRKYIDEYFKIHNIKKSPAFIGFSKTDGSFPVKKKPKWCPLEQED